MLWPLGERVSSPWQTTASQCRVGLRALVRKAPQIPVGSRARHLPGASQSPPGAAFPGPGKGHVVVGATSVRLPGNKQITDTEKNADDIPSNVHVGPRVLQAWLRRACSGSGSHLPGPAPDHVRPGTPLHTAFCSFARTRASTALLREPRVYSRIFHREPRAGGGGSVCSGWFGRALLPGRVRSSPCVSLPWSRGRGSGLGVTFTGLPLSARRPPFCSSRHPPHLEMEPPPRHAQPGNNSEVCVCVWGSDAKLNIYVLG